MQTPNTLYPILSAAAIPILIPEMTSSIAWGVCTLHTLHTPYVRFKTWRHDVSKRTYGMHMLWALGDIIKRKTGLIKTQLHALFFKQTTHQHQRQDYWHRRRCWNKYRPIPIPNTGIGLTLLCTSGVMHNRRHRMPLIHTQVTALYKFALIVWHIDVLPCTVNVNLIHCRCHTANCRAWQ